MPCLAAIKSTNFSIQARSAAAGGSVASSSVAAAHRRVTSLR